MIKDLGRVVGKSAYEIACDNGFVGSEQEWLDSLYHDEIIPPQASAENQLADKDFVNSSIATATSEFVGTFNSLNELQATTKTYDNNDYAFVIGTDSDGNTEYNKYKWNGSEWIFEYTLNNSSFTSEQWKAINSNVTDEWRQSVNTSISNKADKTHTHDNFALKTDLNGLAVSGHTHNEYSKTITFTKSDGTSNVFYYLIAKTYSKDSVSNMDTVFLNGSDYINRMFEGVIRTRGNNTIYNCGKNNLPLEFYSQSDGTINIYWTVNDNYNRIALNVSASQNITIYSGNLINVTPTGTKMTFSVYDYKTVANMNIKNFGSPAGITRYVELTSAENFAGVEVNIAYSGKWYFSQPDKAPLYLGYDGATFNNYGLTGYAWGTDNKKLYLRFAGYRGVSVSVLGAVESIVSISDWTTTSPTLPSGVSWSTNEYDIKAKIDGKSDTSHTHSDYASKTDLINWNIANTNYTGNPNDCEIGQWYSINTSSYSTNMPEINGWSAIITFAANNNAYYKKQICFYTNGARLFTRSCIGGTWGDWKKVVQQDDLSSYATKAELSGKSDTSHTHSDYATKDDILNHTHNDTYYTETEIDNLLKNKSDTSHTHSDYASKTDLNNKVDKVYGKQLSTNDFTNTDKSNLDRLTSTVSSLQSTIRTLQDKIDNLEDRISDIEWQIR